MAAIVESIFVIRANFVPILFCDSNTRDHCAHNTSSHSVATNKRKRPIAIGLFVSIRFVNGARCGTPTNRDRSANRLFILHFFFCIRFRISVRPECGKFIFFISAYNHAHATTATTNALPPFPKQTCKCMKRYFIVSYGR